jgi:small subunit ribosomal protein S3
VIEIKEPALDATLMAEAIALQLKKRASYRRAMKAQCENAMNAGAKGVKIICGGRLAGAEIARSETQKLGSIPLQTLDANVDYGVATSHTTYGTIGVKVWIYKGKFGEEIVPVSRPRRQLRPRRGAGGGRGRSAGGGRGAGGGGRSKAGARRAKTAKTRIGPTVAKTTEATAKPAEAGAETDADNIGPEERIDTDRVAEDKQNGVNA